MKLAGTIFLLALALSAAQTLPGGADSQPTTQAIDESPRFAWVDVYIDPKGQPLAAYQFELTNAGHVTLVGVEGGEHPAFSDAPYYDPKANLQNRIIVAAFNTGDDLPRQRTRVARVMVRIDSGSSPHFSAKLQVAAGPDSKPLNADITLSEGAAK